NFSAASVMANQDGTRVVIGAQTFNLDQGDSVLVTGITIGTAITAAPVSGVGTRTVQVDLLTAQNNSTYEGRFYSLAPVSSWDTSYWVPEPTTVTGSPNVVFLYNPSAANLTV